MVARGATERARHGAGRGPLVIRVLVAGGQAIYREGLKTVLEADGLAVASEAATSEEALNRAQETLPDVVILDISRSGASGVEALQEMKRCEPGIRVLVLAMHPEHRLAARCLRAGADGYLTMHAEAAEILAAVRQIHGGGNYVSPTVGERLACTVECDVDGDDDRSPHEQLSHRELQVMRLIGAGKKPNAIAAELGLSVKTVATHRARILEKMAMRSTAELIRYVVVRGFNK
jgi:two-component system invasion response regulator UvrY